MKKILAFFFFLTLAPFASAQASNTLPPGGILRAGQFLQSNDGFFTLNMQGDCNLVLYWEGPDKKHRAVSQTNTSHRGIGCFVTMQDDGNLVLSDQYQNVVYASGTNGHRGAFAILRNASEGEISDRLVLIHNNHPIFSSARFPGQDMVGVRFR